MILPELRNGWDGNIFSSRNFDSNGSSKMLKSSGNKVDLSLSSRDIIKQTSTQKLAKHLDSVFDDYKAMTHRRDNLTQSEQQQPNYKHEDGDVM